MVYPDRQRDRDRGDRNDRSRHSRNRSPSDQSDRYRHRRSRSRSDSREKRRSRDYRQHKERSHHSHYSRPSRDSHDDRHDRSHSKKRSQSNESHPDYPQRQQQQLQQKIRLSIRTNDFQFNKKLQQAFMQLPERRQQEIDYQARSPQKVHQLIFVRELFVSGINNISDYVISDIFGKYGEIQNIQIIKDFAFVKFYRVEDASNACADYHNIGSTYGQMVNSNFKVLFSDHFKRWNVVSNHPDYEITQLLVPVLYVSIKNDPNFNNEKKLRSIFDRYGFVRNLEIKKNENQSIKLQSSIEYQTLEMAIRAREKLKDKKEKYFGLKNAEISILINSQKFIRTFPNTSNQVRLQKKRMYNANEHMSHGGMSHGGINPMRPIGNSFTNLNPLDPYIPPMGALGSQHSMTNLKNPQPQSSTSSYQTEDIFAMLDKLTEKKKDSQVEVEIQQQADWVGFFTRNNQFKVEVQFNRITKDAPLNLQVILNVSHRGDINEALHRTDYALAGKFRAVNKKNQQAFNQYIKYFIRKNRGGIVFANEYMIYILPPKDDLNLPYKIKPNELLGLFFKIKN